MGFLMGLRSGVLTGDLVAAEDDDLRFLERIGAISNILKDLATIERMSLF